MHIRKLKRGGKVYKARDGRPRWEVIWRDADGKQCSKTFPIKAEAEAYGRKAEEAVRRGTEIDPEGGRQTLRHYSEQWLTTRHRLRPSSRARLESNLREHVLPRFGDKQLRNIKRTEVKSYVGELVESGLSAAAIRKAYFALSQMMREAHADGMIERNPCLEVELPKERSKKRDFLEIGHLYTLADCVPERYRAYVIAGGFAGLRHGEICGLRRGDIDPMHSTVHVRQSLEEIDGKLSFDDLLKTESSSRDVVVARSVMDELERHLERFCGPEPDALLITTEKGQPMYRASFGRIWRDALREARKRSPGFPPGNFTPHDLRHAYISGLIELGVFVIEIAEKVGHKNPSMILKTYGHVYRTRHHQTAEQQDELLTAYRESNVVAIH